MAKRNASTSDDDFLAKARERFNAAREYWNKIYEPAKADLEFYSGDQWPDNVKLQREQPGAQARPCLTINRLPQFHNQIVNDYRQSELGMKASPQETHDIEVARVYTGLFRQIEKQSTASVAYIKALSDGAIHGVGYIRVIARYASDMSFDQDLFIDREVNPFRHYPDPYAEKMFLDDANYWFVISKMPRTEYDDEYPDYDSADFTGEDSLQSDWREGDEIIIAEYYYFETKSATLVQLRDGSTAWEADVTDEQRPNIKRKKKVDKKVLKWCKIDGYNVLEKPTALPTPRIPIVPVWGNELWVGDKRLLSGIVAGAKDSQRMYNYWQSAKTEMIALAPKAPYIAAEGQLEGREDEWQDAATTPKSVLYYKPVSVDGHLVGAPQRQTYEAPVQGIIQASMQSSDDMKATIGIYDASLGAKGNEVSGRAILARKTQGATATYNFVDNLALAIGYIGTIISEQIPIIYDTERTLQIVGDDGKPKSVSVNGNGQPDIVNVNYDLVLDSGPSYATQREETTAIFTELARQYPKVFDVAGDIILSNMDVAGAQEIAARLKRTLPPQVVGEEEDAETKLAAAQTQIQQLTQAAQAMTGKMSELEMQAEMDKVTIKDKAGELNIRQQEMRIKRDEARAKLITAGALAAGTKEQASAAPLVQQALKSITELHDKVDGLQDMVQASAEEPAGGASPSAGAMAAPPSAAPTPASPPAAPTDDTSDEGTGQ